MGAPNAHQYGTFYLVSALLNASKQRTKLQKFNKTTYFLEKS